MAEIINLRRARKDRARVAREKTADENRVRFGRTKAEREQAEQNAALAERRLEGHRRIDDAEASDRDPPES